MSDDCFQLSPNEIQSHDPKISENYLIISLGPTIQIKNSKYLQLLQISYNEKEHEEALDILLDHTTLIFL